ncbi:hypothetical protein GCM10009625_33120 [Brachybacterium fresconis]
MWHRLLGHTLADGHECRCFPFAGRAPIVDHMSSYSNWGEGAGVSPVVSWREELRVEPCSQSDLEHLLSQDLTLQVAAHHRERFALQRSGVASYLLAWRGPQNVGRATIYNESKYKPVRAAHPGVAEINALEAEPRRQGIGTAIITAAELVAARQGRASMGLAVEPSNPEARRLYERLGYVLWGRGEVTDEWVESGTRGEVVHQNSCDYMIKSLSSVASGPALDQDDRDG